MVVHQLVRDVGAALGVGAGQRHAEVVLPGAVGYLGVHAGGRRVRDARRGHDPCTQRNHSLLHTRRRRVAAVSRCVLCTRTDVAAVGQRPLRDGLHVSAGVGGRLAVAARHLRVQADDSVVGLDTTQVRGGSARRVWHLRVHTVCLQWDDIMHYAHI